MLQRNKVTVTNDVSEPVEPVKPEENNIKNDEMLTEIRNRFIQLTSIFTKI